ncbi:MAG TPA: hypothetical protein ENG11_03285 [candidate division Zixibacteria bacterium]|nr:hypothetical protein [candidate division Zixibacteria bacterium]
MRNFSFSQDFSLFEFDGKWININSPVPPSNLGFLRYVIVGAMVLSAGMVAAFLVLNTSRSGSQIGTVSLGIMLLIMVAADIFALRMMARIFPIKIDISTRTGYIQTPILRFKLDLSDVSELCVRKRRNQNRNDYYYVLCGRTPAGREKTIITLPQNWRDKIDQIREIAGYLGWNFVENEN